MASQNIENVIISLEDSVNVGDELLTVTFNPSQMESSQQQAGLNPSSEPMMISEKAEKFDVISEDVALTEEISLQSASQYFLEDSTPTRSRTTSDNEFFDHLVAGDSAMMADENVCDVNPVEIAEISSVETNNIVHCDSTAKLSVTSENEQNLPDEHSGDVEAKSVTHENYSVDCTFESKNDTEDGIVMAVTSDSETINQIKGKNDENALQTAEVTHKQSEDNDDIPVFRYFSEDSNATLEISTSAFDNCAGSITKVENVPEADAFSAAIEESEFNRRSDAWIPSQSTCSAISAAQTGSSCAHQITQPKLIVTDILNDPILPMMVSTVEASLSVSRKSNMLTHDSVQPNENGLRQLMEKGCYRAAINLTTKLISNFGQVHKLTPELLQLWFCRIGLLVKIKMFKEAFDESLPFSPGLDNPDIYYDFYPDVYTGRKGSMACFGFRLLLAEISRYVGQYEQSLERLYVLLNTVMMIIKNLDKGLSEDGSQLQISEANRKASRELWCQRERNVLYSLVNACTSHKDYLLAINLMNSLIEKESDDKKPFLWSAKGRIFLQLGNVVGAQDCFSNASSDLSDELKANKELSIMELINRSMVAVAQNSFQDAYTFYKEASELDPSDPMLRNNMAACLLYTGKMKESLSTLEEAIMNDPENYLHEGILFNVCTLYELESSHSNQKKANMLALISQYKGDAFNTACLKFS
ncbi:Trafficking protein particle complex subunit 12 [Nymphon striatum]|nr:Trafficking protein particle complex subunit 12 [Nymphon striatum]